MPVDTLKTRAGRARQYYRTRRRLDQQATPRLYRTRSVQPGETATPTDQLGSPAVFTVRIDTSSPAGPVFSYGQTLTMSRPTAGTLRVQWFDVPIIDNQSIPVPTELFVLLAVRPGDGRVLAWTQFGRINVNQAGPRSGFAVTGDTLSADASNVSPVSIYANQNPRRTIGSIEGPIDSDGLYALTERLPEEDLSTLYALFAEGAG